MLDGEVTVELPSSHIPEHEFKHRYEQYKLLMKQLAAAEELTRKKELVAQRKRYLEEVEAGKAGEDMEHRSSVGSLEGDRTKKPEPQFGKQNSLLNPQM